MTQYTVDYFISKFEKIPEGNFISNSLYNEIGGKCVNGWCGVTNCCEPNKESAALQTLFTTLPVTWFDHGDTPITESWDYEGYSVKAVYINNGGANEYQQPTPKARILAALYDIKKMQSETIEPTHDPIVDKPTYPDKATIWEDITASLAVLPTEEVSDLVTVKVL